MFDELFKLSKTLTEIQLGAQRVIAMRILRLARGDALARREARRMVIEKVAMSAHGAALFASGENPQVILNRVKRAVRANETRLLKRGR